MNCGGFRSRSRGLQGRVGHGNFPVTSTGIQVKVLKSRFTWAPIQTGWLRPLKCNFEYLQNIYKKTPPSRCAAATAFRMLSCAALPV